MHKDGCPAIFLDRDGVINREVGYITSWEQLEIYPFAVEAIKLLKENGWKCIVITNQSAVARGMLGEYDLQQIHQRLLELVPVDDIYYCPHYPPKDGVEIPPYNIMCRCRKPGNDMILQAARRHGVDLSKSYLIGDRATDILAGQSAGLKTVLVSTGYGPLGLEQEVQPDYIFEDVYDFVNHLINKRI